jgi:hypothetical protein
MCITFQKFYTVISSFSIKSVDGKVIFHGSMKIIIRKSTVYKVMATGILWIPAGSAVVIEHLDASMSLCVISDRFESNQLLSTARPFTGHIPSQTDL